MSTESKEGVVAVCECEVMGVGVAIARRLNTILSSSLSSSSSQPLNTQFRQCRERNFIVVKFWHTRIGHAILTLTLTLTLTLNHNNRRCHFGSMSNHFSERQEQCALGAWSGHVARDL